jgi:HEAT repeat protein
MLVPRLAETLATEARARARQRLTDLLIGFGEHGRRSVAQLRQSPNPSVRRTAVQLLRSFGGPEALPDLEQLVNDPEAAVQREAARALIGFGFDESFDLLKRILRDEKHAGRKSVIEELGSARDPKARPLFCYLVRRLECRGSLREVYMRAIDRLGLIGGKEGVEALSEVLRKGQWWAPMRTREVRAEAAAALAQIKLPEAQEALREAATNGSFGVRAIARRHVRDDGRSQ